MKLWDVLEAAGQKDLDDVVQRIAEAERQLKTLRCAERLLTAKVRQASPDPPSETDQSSPPSDRAALLDTIYRYLDEHGASSPKQVAAGCGIDSRQVGMLVNRCEWFKRDGRTIEIARTAGPN